MSTPPVSTGRPRTDSVRDPRSEWMLILLSAASGAADAFAFICVGQVFAGVMTGNLVLLGASAAGSTEAGVAQRVMTALVSYGCGVVCGAWMSERLRWRLSLMLLTEVALLASGAVVWGLGPVTSDGGRLGLLVIFTVAMGIQGRIRATPTNYFTGTLTSLVGRLALRAAREGDRWVAGRLLAVVAGAAGTASMVRVWPDGAAAVAAALAAGALLAEVAPRRLSRR
ncbi:YoaK family protein [Streptomyces sp. NPDC058231]|uniref:YoaK family protein n=1 Tax=Streptomyces sp. NPDC058231 TaxID=3346392 RepID=UPI0036EEDC74